MTPGEKVRWKELAKQVLENPAYQKAWRGVFAGYTNSWANSELMTPEERETLFLRMRELKAVQMELEAMLAEGERAEHELEEARKRNGNEQ